MFILNGFVSIVSDGYDSWDVIGRVLPALKDKIMARNGGPAGDGVVIRPDSGDVLIVCQGPSPLDYSESSYAQPDRLSMVDPRGRSPAEGRFGFAELRAQPQEAA